MIFIINSKIYFVPTIKTLTERSYGSTFLNYSYNKYLLNAYYASVITLVTKNIERECMLVG